MADSGNGAEFTKSGTATTTETATALLASWGGTDPHRYKASKVTVTNDGSVALLYSINKSAADGGTQHSLSAGETFVHENCHSAGLWVETASSTTTFRAWGQG